MRAMITLDEKLLSDAEELTGIKERELFLHEGLRALIARENARAIIALGGSDPDARAAERWRPTPPA